MENSIQKKLYGLDHLRALAICLVFLYHYQIMNGEQPAWLTSFAKFGWTGVDLFFVLSGFLISSQLFDQIKRGQLISFRLFFLKRFFRIIPAFLVTVALYFCFPFFHEREALPPLWKFLTFTQNFGLNLKVSGTFSHAWSLCVEEHFYLLLPLTLIFLQRTKLLKKSYWLIAALFILGFTARVYSFNHLYLPKAELENGGIYWYQYVYYPTYNRLDGLLTGVSVAAVYCFLPEAWNKISKYGNLFLVLSMAVLTTAYFLCDDQFTYSASIFGFPVIALGYGLMVAGAVSKTSFLYKWNSRITTLIASISYAVYLTHKGIIHIIHKLLAGFQFDNNLLFFICIVTSGFAAFLLYTIIEKPFMKLRKKISVAE